MDVFKTLIHSQPGAVGSTVAITGGSVNGTNIGATTPGTGAFTTLAASGVTSLTGTNAATAVNEGVLRSANFGLSGNSGGPSYFGGDVLAGQATATNGIRISASAVASESSIFLRDVGTTTAATVALSGNQSYTILNTPTGGTLYLRRGNDSAAGLTFNGTTAAFGASAVVTVANTTASTTTATGGATFAGGIGVAGNVVSGGTVRTGAFTVATLPTASTYPGGLAYVTDASATTRLSTVSGSGSNKVMVFSDGTNWLIL